MKLLHFLLYLILATGDVGAQDAPRATKIPDLAEQNQVLLDRLKVVHGLTDAQTSAIRDIFSRSRCIGQGTRRSPGIPPPGASARRSFET